MSSQRFIFHLKAFSKLYERSSCKFGIRQRSFTMLLCHNRTPIAAAQTLPLLDSVQSRNYPKNRDKVRTGARKIEIRDDIMAEAINVDKFRGELQAALDELRDQYIKQLSLRSAAGVVETLTLEFEGDEYQIQDLAQINRKNPKVLVLNLSSFPQTIPAVLEAITKSGMNLNPQQDGTSIFVPIPKITREHRENLAKGAKTLFNKCKDEIRNIQSKYMRKLDLKQSQGLSIEKTLLIRDQIMAVANHYATLGEKMRDDKQRELLKDE